jgi:hypothetical protein
MARTLLARTAVVTLTAFCALTAGAVTAGAAAADPAPGLLADVPANSAAVLKSPVFADNLGRKLK